MDNRPIRILLVAAATALSTLSAQEMTKDAKIEKILALTHVDQMFGQMKSVNGSGLGSAGMSWEKQRPLWVKVYRETYSDEEIDGILAFYQSPAGKAMLDKTPAFSARLAALEQDQFKDLAPEDKAPWVGRPAPEFRLKNLKGDDVALADFKGKVVLVDFWATWCGPCKEEMPAFEKVHRDEDVVVLAVDVDEPVETVAPFIERGKYTFPVLLAAGTEVVSRYGVKAYPTTFAIDKNGLVADIVLGGGPNSGALLGKLIAKARAGAPPPTAVPVPSPPVAPADSKPAPPAAPTPSVTAEDFYRDAYRLRVLRDYEGALKALARALELRPDWMTAEITQAEVYLSAHKYDDAIAAYSHLIRRDPSRATSYDSRGRAYSDSKRHAQAIPDYTRGIELNPQSYLAYNNRGWANLELGHLEEALTDLNKAIELNPANATALFNRAHLFEKQKEYAKAVEDYDRILHILPTDAAASNQKAADLRKRALVGAADVAPAGALGSDVPDLSGVWVETQPKSGPPLRLQLSQSGLRVKVQRSYRDFFSETDFEDATVVNGTAIWSKPQGCFERYQWPGYNYDNPGVNTFKLSLRQPTDAGETGPVLVYVQETQWYAPCASNHPIGTERDVEKILRRQ